jgi:hypothetical protein
VSSRQFVSITPMRIPLVPAMTRRLGLICSAGRVIAYDERGATIIAPGAMGVAMRTRPSGKE